jgi:hypothetical protein
MLKNQETADKILNDRERSSRNDRRQIEFLEADNRRIKALYKEIQEKYAEKEKEKKDAEKDIEQMTMELKNMQKRFETEKLRVENF